MAMVGGFMSRMRNRATNGKPSVDMAPMQTAGLPQSQIASQPQAGAVQNSNPAGTPPVTIPVE